MTRLPLAAAAAAFLACARAVTLFVAPSGSPAAPCTAATPCDFTTAIGLARPGDRVSAASGNYSTPLAFTRSGTSDAARITVAAAIAGAVFVPNVTFASASYVTLDGISVDRAVRMGRRARHAVSPRCRRDGDRPEFELGHARRWQQHHSAVSSSLAGRQRYHDENFAPRRYCKRRAEVREGVARLPTSRLAPPRVGVGNLRLVCAARLHRFFQLLW